MRKTALERPRLVIAGTASGVGKTTVVIGLVRALRALGLKVAVFKCGPDYLDPTYHARAAGVASHNLDGWMMGREGVLSTFLGASEGSDVSVIEGVMGLFDGASPTGDEGSTAEIAKWLDAPVILVVDAAGMARSIAAVALGFRELDPKLRLSGLVANRVGSRGHLEILERASLGTRILGGLPKDAALALAERHLGLRTADEEALPETVLEGWRTHVSEWFDLGALVELARSAPAIEALARTQPCEADHDAEARPRCRIGIAQDAAFHFYYPENLKLLERYGAELVPFSPIADPRLPEVDALYFGGGYPEVHGRALANNVAMRRAVAELGAAGRPIYAECGGLMYLTGAIQTLAGERFPMVGLLGGEAVMSPKLQALGYVEVEIEERSLFGDAGVRFRGHQFRYSELRDVPPEVERIYRLRRRRGGEVTREGYRVKNVLGSYVHAHWASNPRAAERLVRFIEATR